jgi:hypothetical protein
MAYVLQIALNPRVPHFGFSSAIRTPSRRISKSMPRLTGWLAYVHSAQSAADASAATCQAS